MQKNYKLLASALIIIVGIIGVIVLFNYPKVNKTKVQGYGGSFRTSYDMIGSASSLASINTSYASSTSTIKAGYLENAHFDVQLLTTSTNNIYAEILVEGSNDNGTTYFPITSKVVRTTGIDIYTEDIDGNIGIPVNFPGDMTTATGTTYSGSFDFDMVADHIRVQARTNTSTASLYVRGTLTSN